MKAESCAVVWKDRLLFVHSSVSGHSGGFCFIVVRNDAYNAKYEHSCAVHMWLSVCIPLGQMGRSGIARFDGNSALLASGSGQTVF